MDSFLVVGVDTIVGANLAATLSDRYNVTTWAPESGYEIANCNALDPADAPRKAIDSSKADWIVYCGAAARSAWEPNTKSLIKDEMVGDAHQWAIACREAGKRLIMISSDAVFTGPWMFHDEESPGFCASYPSQAIRAAEMQVLEHCPQALVIRTNAFGWSPAGDAGWIETMLKDVETRRIVQQDHIRHSTPILATDLALILERACTEQLSGIYHIAGAERSSPLQFAQRLADLFDLRWLAMRKESSLSELPQGFAEGECSLQTKKIRLALCVPMPLLSEGLQRLREQHENGWRDRLRSTQADQRKERRAA
ncbi:sugar nucleotide-binding protein [Planctomicrobium sp. SH664]|uniref:sugar nucleotide-binding protein n=1 Tax=Planctomicrobium sp. SH664 TaxID=3448125 RepID=UPI003F5BE1F6